MDTDQIELAAHELVLHNGKYKVKELAAMLSINEQVLRNKVNPNCESHKLGLMEAVAIQLLLKDFRIHRAIDVYVESLKQVPEQRHILEVCLSLNVAAGKINEELHKALEDNILTKKEREQLQRQIDEAEEQLRAMRHCINTHSNYTHIKVN